jgi:hypothetical protein
MAQEEEGSHRESLGKRETNEHDEELMNENDEEEHHKKNYDTEYGR